MEAVGYPRLTGWQYQRQVFQKELISRNLEALIIAHKNVRMNWAFWPSQDLQEETNRPAHKARNVYMIYATHYTYSDGISYSYWFFISRVSSIDTQQLIVKMINEESIARYFFSNFTRQNWIISILAVWNRYVVLWSELTNGRHSGMKGLLTCCKWKMEYMWNHT